MIEMLDTVRNTFKATQTYPASMIAAQAHQTEGHEKVEAKVIKSIEPNKETMKGTIIYLLAK